MEEIDMSRPGYELFPESGQQSYNSYMDVNVTQGQDVGDPLNTGVPQQQLPELHETFDAAGQGQQQGSKDYNFKALRDEVSKMKEEREYWKGQAEAYSRQPAQQEQKAADPYESLDWDDSKDVRKAFETVRQENQRMRDEMKDAVKAMSIRADRPDWNQMVTNHVPELTNKNPIFAEMIQKASNPYEAAYLLAELNARASQPVATQPPPVNGNAQRAINNASKPQTLASVGGGGTLSSADYYASMSDDDFMKIASKNLANI